MAIARVGATIVLVVAAAAAAPTIGRAQSVDARASAHADAVAQWIALAAPPGVERAATDIISASIPGWTGSLGQSHHPPRIRVAAARDRVRTR